MSTDLLEESIDTTQNPAFLNLTYNNFHAQNMKHYKIASCKYKNGLADQTTINFLNFTIIKKYFLVLN